MRRRKPVLVAVALCLGGALTACGGGGDGEGFAAVGAGPSPGGAVGPSGAVTLVPLDSPTAPGLASSTSSPPPSAPPSSPGASPSPPSAGPESRTGASTGPGPSGTRTGAGADPGGTGRAGGSGGGTAPGAPPGGPSSGAPSSGATTPPPRTPGPPPAPTTPAPTATAPSPRPTTPAPPPGPAVLTVSAPVTADADARWCERVTVTFRNTGGSPAASGTATFETHIVGALGIDWGTVTTSQPLPAPIAAGSARTRTYTVCVESWRVPIGMRVDTRAVTASWR
ncbi:hypothetical protein [Streptomyces sp. NPDC057854]|uniref:hypothetical protein n=1 Tax=unclassified Streptomyces TaxID=2593676 RepID=UPI0036785467